MSEKFYYTSNGFVIFIIFREFVGDFGHDLGDDLGDKSKIQEDALKAKIADLEKHVKNEAEQRLLVVKKYRKLKKKIKKLKSQRAKSKKKKKKKAPAPSKPAYKTFHIS